MNPSCFRSIVLAAAAATALAGADGTAPAPVRPKQDASGNPIRYAATGHVSNYDEAKVAPYRLPDPLKFNDGERVRTAADWTQRRRGEIFEAYQREIYGRVPKSAPPITFTVASEETALDGAAKLKHIVGRIGSGEDAPQVHVALYLPAKATAPVPVMLHMQFFGGGAPGAGRGGPAAAKGGPSAADAGAAKGAAQKSDANAKAAPARGGRGGLSEDGPIAEFLARGYGYATVRYTEFEGDSAATNLTLLRKQALASGQEKPAPDEWGTIAAWTYGVSRVLDYFSSDPAIDAKRAGIIGHSRLGKTALWAGATDARWAIVFSSCAGEMGSALARRDWGESVDDMAANFPWQFAGNFQKYAGHWNDMPVDAHMLIALSAPRPVFITGGTQDQWADPRGEFLAEVAASPVYQLFRKPGMQADVFKRDPKDVPPLDTALIDGTLGFRYHTGGHTITPEDWRAFLDFADRQLKSGAK